MTSLSIFMCSVMLLKVLFRLFSEVMKVLREKKYAKMNKNLHEIDSGDQNSSCDAEAKNSGLERPTQVTFKINPDFGNHKRALYYYIVVLFPEIQWLIYHNYLVVTNFYTEVLVLSLNLHFLCRVRSSFLIDRNIKSVLSSRKSGDHNILHMFWSRQCIRE